MRPTNRNIATQRQTGRFPKRNRAYIGFHSIDPFPGPVATARAFGPEDGAALVPSILAAYRSALPGEMGLVAGVLARCLAEK